jgi:hypothetical protein
VAPKAEPGGLPDCLEARKNNEMVQEVIEMKRIAGVLIAVLLVFGVAFQASAAPVGNLINIIYENDPQGNQGYRFLGNLNAIGQSDPFDISGTFTEPFDPNFPAPPFASAADLSDLNLAVYGISQQTASFYFATQSSLVPGINLANVNRAINPGFNFAVGTDGGFDEKSNPNGYFDNFETSVPGALNGFLTSADAVVNLGSLTDGSGNAVTGNSIELYLWRFDPIAGGFRDVNGALNSAAIAKMLVSVQEDLQGNQFLQKEIAPVPIPGAVWLLGSGLLALVGLRRKRG